MNEADLWAGKQSLPCPIVESCGVASESDEPVQIYSNPRVTRNTLTSSIGLQIPNLRPHGTTPSEFQISSSQFYPPARIDGVFARYDIGTNPNLIFSNQLDTKASTAENLGQTQHPEAHTSQQGVGVVTQQAATTTWGPDVPFTSA